MIRAHDLDIVIPSPESPPGMTASKSSKSSSFQSFSSDDGSVLADVGHFEDIGLDDDTDTVTLKSPSEVNIRSLAVKAPTGRTLAAGRTALKGRPPFPALQTNVFASNPRSTNLSALTEPLSASRPKPLTSPSTSSLPFPRRRTPSPAYSLNPRDPSRPAKPRRGSWQTNRDRKSFTDLERECDEDDGDDIPDGLVLDNVPISPRPPQERSPSRTNSISPSPDRAPKERVRSVGNGTPAVAQAQGSLRSPSWKSDAPPRSPLKARAHSWNAALAELNAEAKALTEKLEEHADEMDESQTKRPNGTRPNTWASTRRRSVDSSYDKRERIKSTPELPPLRKTNIMIDPLPISKEKEAVLSRTRPSWLPPKDPAEEKRHLKEYQKMMAASARSEERREATRKAKVEGRDVTADNLMHIWERDVIPRWNDAIRERRTRELWWKGVAPRSRGVVWSRAIGNELGLSETSFEAALARAREVDARVKDDKGDADDVRKAKWFQEIRKDASERTWKDLRIFEVSGPLNQSLIDVLSAYAMYRSDIGYVSGCNTIAALLLLNLPNPAAAFISLSNVLNRPLPLSFYAADPGAQSSACNLVLQTLALKSPTLHHHLTMNVDPATLEAYLRDIFTSMFTAQLAIDEAARLWDVYVFEGDGLMVRAAVAFLLSREMTLLGTKNSGEVKAVLSVQNASVRSARPAGEVGAEDRFMISVREAGKA
ncbi:hypothetical protein BGZ61DRAFT_340206 [Ilyonectria robusta]|uniref:uncharacterized protein n=1 Tax=Ilyonectria robusta TaxID=1079257 RepID=UPI001E8ED11B|nr:uncharacterized protein BGZ61DRAFT_340206 [Ilyonectria robusta]KAH8736171.1 hypothetical protein BGZ61DRAFT_340206 [Ilyonectria robusta]